MSKDKIQKRITEEICHFLPQGKRIKERKKHRSDRLEGRVTEKDVVYVMKAQEKGWEENSSFNAA